jgi:hypothetical protein
MASDPVRTRPPRPLLTFGRVDVVRVQVGYRASPESPPYMQFLLDFPVPEPGNDGVPRIDEDRVLAALEQVLYVGGDTPRHYSLHEHRWHTSWGASPGALEIGLLVTTDPRTAGAPRTSDEVVTSAFRDLLEAARAERPPASRDAAILRARRSAATAFGVDPDGLSLSAEEHDPVHDCWSLLLRTTSEDEYDVLVGLVDGHAGSVRVRHGRRTEVADAVGSE